MRSTHNGDLEKKRVLCCSNLSVVVLTMRSGYSMSADCSAIILTAVPTETLDHLLKNEALLWICSSEQSLSLLLYATLMKVIYYL